MTNKNPKHKDGENVILSAPCNPGFISVFSGWYFRSCHLTFRHALIQSAHCEKLVGKERDNAAFRPLKSDLPRQTSLSFQALCVAFLATQWRHFSCIPLFINTSPHIHNCRKYVIKAFGLLFHTPLNVDSHLYLREHILTVKTHSKVQ